MKLARSTSGYCCAMKIAGHGGAASCHGAWYTFTLVCSSSSYHLLLPFCFFFPLEWVGGSLGEVGLEGKEALGFRSLVERGFGILEFGWVGQGGNGSNEGLGFVWTHDFDPGTCGDWGSKL